MPVHAVSCQAGYLQSEHDPRSPKAYFRDQPLKPFPIRGRSPGLAKVGINHVSSLHGPTQRHGPLTKCILTFGGRPRTVVPQ